MANIGFDRVNFYFITEHIEIEESARYSVTDNYRDNLASHYTENKHFESDPVVQQIIHNKHLLGMTCDQLTHHDLGSRRRAKLYRHRQLAIFSCYGLLPD